MEELLNKLIEKGWKPFNRDFNGYEHGCLIREFITKDGVYSYGQYPTTYRELVSKESGLWQFVCENGIANTIYRTWDKFDENDCPVPNQQHLDKYYEYRLIESALTEEDKLEEFLLNNIKIEGKTD